MLPSPTASPVFLLPCCCSVQYATGETEALDLDEVVRDGHMSLLAESAV